MGVLSTINYTLRYFLSGKSELDLFVSLSFLAVALLVPACGYFGVRDRSQSLLQWFWTCNGLGAFL